MLQNCEYYPLTHPQRGIWYTEKLYPGTSIGVIAATLKIYGNVDYALLEKALNYVIEKNDAFRTKIVEIDGNPCQFITPYQYRKIELVDFSNRAIEEMYEWDTRQARTPLDINNLEFCKFYLIKIGKNQGGFFIKIHHTLADAWSIILFGNEVMKFYNDLKNSENIDDQCFPSYTEYIESEQKYLASERFLKDRQFWNEMFHDVPEAAVLKTRKSNSIDTNAKRKTFVLPAKLCNKLQQYCKEHKISILAAFISALSLYINRVTNKSDIVIGTPVLNRTTVREKETIGMFINTMPVRINFDNTVDFSVLTQGVTKTLFQSLKHQKYAADYLIEDIRATNSGFERLFDICLSYQNAKFVKYNDEDAQEGRWHFSGRQLESLYIHINEREGDGELIIDYDYLSDLFHAKEIEFLHDHLIRLLWHAIDNPGKMLSSIEMVSEREKSRILYEFNNTDAEFPKQKTIVDIFEEQVKATPDNIALVFDNQQMTYSQLNETANRLARVLRNNGVVPDDVIGIMTYRSFDMIVGILAIIKSGGAYLPIDPEYPSERINYLLDNSNVKILTTSSKISKAKEGILFKGKLVYFEDKEIEKESPDDLPHVNKPEDLMYIIYTSGSTGKPKGVMIEHHSVVNRIHWMQKKYCINQDDVLIQKTPYTFDVSVWELTWWFFTGARLVILKPGGEKDPRELIEAIYENKVTVIHFVPSMLNAFLEYLVEENDVIRLSSLKRVFCSGEALTPVHAGKFYKTFSTINGISLHNLYGPTEATVDVSYFDCSPADRQKKIPIGKPIDNTQLYILDRFMNILPIGASGELYIAGEGLARGYINNPGLTESKFVSNPFMDGKRMYKTGDLARWYPKGDIEFLGRMDHQVKIRGYRIELGEIQEELLKIPSVHDALVVCKEGEHSEKYICAYLVFNYKDSVSNIKKALMKNLPSYMIPAYFVELDSIPLSENGKMNIKLLPDPFSAALKDVEYVAPRNDMERNIQMVWEKAIQGKSIGVKDNFFDIGGDSLCAMRIVSMLNDRISVEDIYKNPTIELLAEHMESNSNINLLVNLTDDITNPEESIICFPYGGGSSIVFRKLAEALNRKSGKFAVYAYGKPEQEGDIKQASQKVVQEITRRISGNIHIYGHCVGSAIAYETARQLEEAGYTVTSLMVGGSFPPFITKIFSKPINPWTKQTDKNILRFFRYLGHESTEQISKNIVDAFRNDVGNYFSFYYSLNEKQSKKVNTRIICIVGEDDPLTRNFKTRYKAWYKYSNEVYILKIENAKHYFVETHADDLADIIVRTVKNEGELLVYEK